MSERRKNCKPAQKSLKKSFRDVERVEKRQVKG
jgi:hypothetical protein